ncbi:MAG TPA: HD domain-containing phosphohydrolase, partial [Solirubrobacteraceae bacterium]
FGAVALAMLVYDHAIRVSGLAVALAAASVVAVMARMGMAMAENLRLLARTREEALTDALTGLGNRRRLLADLDAALAHGRPSVLMLFDLNGFKTYNDSFGHPAGDALLHQLGRRLRALAVPLATAYRLGGDEFCLIADEAGAEVALARALEALTAEGEAFAIDASWGQALLPAEASDPSGALGLADTRMYARKQAGRPSPGRQSTDVLLRVLQERHPDLSDHLRGVARLAHDVGARLGMTGAALDDTRFAAELHDVGKVAIPETILDKPGPLDAAERAFMHRHTIIGERIVAAAPALARAARLVRSSHEFWNGRGYPDGLAGEEIPLGARVVAACDAFEAITSDRPYRAARSITQAVLELERCAGTQFDPPVVAALVACVDEREAAGLDVLEGLRAAAPWA